jgi:hypothetical protein
VKQKFLKLVDGKWIVLVRKHQGEPLEKVAVSDPKYLNWLYNEPSVMEALDDAQFYALEDAMKAHKIPLEPIRKSKVASKHAPGHPSSVHR